LTKNAIGKKDGKKFIKNTLKHLKFKQGLGGKAPL
jgi:hypothetical protein